MAFRLLRRRRVHRHARDPIADRSLQHSMRDAMAYAIMQGGAENYLSAFSLFCRASAAQVALLATLPQLLGSLAQLLGAWLARHTRRRKPVIQCRCCGSSVTITGTCRRCNVPRAFSGPASHSAPATCSMNWFRRCGASIRGPRHWRRCAHGLHVRGIAVAEAAASKVAAIDRHPGRCR